MHIRSQIGLTFDDVLLVPKHSNIRSRSHVNPTGLLVPGIQLSIPIISANMDTVTEAKMAIAMAQSGGLGVIHRFMTMEQQAAEVEQVKRSESFVVEQPLTITLPAEIMHARQRMAQSGVGGLLVVDDDGSLLGMVTTRDILLAADEHTPLEQVMTPREKLITAQTDASLESARLTLHQHRLEKLPLVDIDGHVSGLITAKDIIKLEQHPQATKDAKGRLRVGVAVGVKAEDIERAAACIQAGADVLVLDIAHGHAEHAMQMTRSLKARFSQIPLIAGNVATAEGVRDLAQSGADAVKVGVGAGSICITRVVTGFGVPQFSAIADCAQAARELSVPIVADGGVRTSGDLTKALAAGANTAMLGSALAGTDESPGVAVVRQGRRYKVVRGMASLTANISRKQLGSLGRADEEAWEQVVPEGVEAVVPYRGSVKDILYQFVGGLRSGMSYAGARTIEELWQNAEFIRITPAGKQESGPHDVNLM